MLYTERDTIEKLINAMEQLASLHKSAVIKYSGRTRDTRRYYSEVCSEYLLERLRDNHNLFDVIHPVREKPYFVPSHLSGVVGINRENDDEENTVKRMVFGNYNLGELGMPIDFQVPLNEKRKNKRGDIDLLTFNIETNSLYIVETKSITSEEQALRAILEVATYRKMIDENKIKAEYKKVLRDYYECDIVENEISFLKTSVLLFEGSVPSNQIQANDTCGEKLRTLSQELEVEIFIIPPPDEPKRLKL